MITVIQCADGLQRTPIGIEHEVCEDIALRQEMGINKYQTTVDENPLTASQWAQHAYEESLDKAIYLKKLIKKLKHIEELHGPL